MPSMSPWLSNKVIKSLPFQFTGLDYFGPLYIKSLNHVDRRKVWVCLFTCVDVREIHVETVADLSAEEFPDGKSYSKSFGTMHLKLN